MSLIGHSKQQWKEQAMERVIWIDHRRMCWVIKRWSWKFMTLYGIPFVQLFVNRIVDENRLIFSRASGCASSQKGAKHKRVLLVVGHFDCGDRAWIDTCDARTFHIILLRVRAHILKEAPAGQLHTIFVITDTRKNWNPPLKGLNFHRPMRNACYFRTHKQNPPTYSLCQPHYLAHNVVTVSWAF